MELKSAPYTYPVRAISWSQERLPNAGVFLLEGECHFVPYHTAAAETLLQRGALHIGTLRFDRDPLERAHPDRAVTRIREAELCARVSADASRN